MGDNLTITGTLLIPDGGTIGSASVTDAISITSAGRVGIDAASPSTTLHVNNSGGAGIRISRDAQDGYLQMDVDGTNAHIANPRSDGKIIFKVNGDVNRFQIAEDGDITGTHGTYHDGSDSRIKKEIVTIPNALTKVAALRGVNFKWKDESKGTALRMGLIAQEVEAVIPEVIHTQAQAYINESEEEEGGLKAVEYQYIAGLLIEAIKELKVDVDALKSA